MTEEEDYKPFLRYYQRLQRIMKENGEVPLTDEEVEKKARSALEKHKNMVAIAKKKEQR